MDRVELLVSLPAVGEDNHAVWRRPPTVHIHEAWNSKSQLIIEQFCVGHIRPVGSAGKGSLCERMSELIGGLQAFDDQMVDLIKELLDLRYSAVVPSSNHSADSDRPVLSASANRTAVDSVVIRVLSSVGFSLAIPIAHRCNWCRILVNHVVENRRKIPLCA